MEVVNSVLPLFGKGVLIIIIIMIKINLLSIFDLVKDCTVNEAVYFWRTLEIPNNSWQEALMEWEPNSWFLTKGSERLTSYIQSALEPFQNEWCTRRLSSLLFQEFNRSGIKWKRDAVLFTTTSSSSSLFFSLSSMEDILLNHWQKSTSSTSPKSMKKWQSWGEDSWNWSVWCRKW